MLKEKVHLKNKIYVTVLRAIKLESFVVTV